MRLTSHFRAARRIKTRSFLQQYACSHTRRAVRHSRNLSMSRLSSYDPYNQEVVGDVAITEASEIAPMVAQARLAQTPWAALSLATRLAVRYKAPRISHKKLPQRWRPNPWVAMANYSIGH